jgi:hypothetical protein
MIENILAEAIRIALAAMSKYKLHPDLAARYGVASAIVSAIGQQVPEITSGYRSLSYQRELYDRWKAGEKGIYKPAQYSRHTTTVLGIPSATALDVNTKRTGFQLFIAVWKALGGNWGGDYKNSDPPHFSADWPTYPQPTKSW